MNNPLKKMICLCLTVSILSVCTQQIESADWPMWRGNVERSGVTSEVLPNQLYLSWSRQLPPHQVAWPNEERLQYDLAYEPISVGNRVLVGSPLEGTLTAYDAKTGDLVWKFYSNGPVRFAPVVSDKKIIFGSDDGYLYCLKLADGELHWKIKGAPDSHQERWHLGNNRLVSYWPVRGAPVVQDGIVFFGAGIWPSMGTYLSAVDIETGKRKWINKRIQYLKNVRIDHNYLHEAGLSPQGYCLLADKKLVVPNGRSMPARIDPETGKMHYYVQGYRNGDSRVMAAGDYLLVGHSGVVNLADGREVGNRWVDAGKEAPKTWSTPKRDLFEGPFDAYKMMPGCSFRSVYEEGICYGVERGVVYAYDLSKSQKSLYEKKHGAQNVKPAKWEAPLLWKLDTKLGKEVTYSIIKAGNTLYAHTGKTLFATEIAKDQKSARIVWQHTLPAPAGSLIAANKRLTVSCLNGELLCFEAEKQTPQTHALVKHTLKSESDLWKKRAQELLKISDSQEGFCVVSGVESASLLDELLLQSDMRLIVIDDDTAMVNSLRKKYLSAGLYGDRMQILNADPATFKMPEYLASLLLVTKTPLSKIGAVKAKLASVRPYGGVACFAVNESNRLANQKIVDGDDPKHWDLTLQGKYAVFHRQGALPGSSDWTHECSDAARSYYSRDQLVKSPLGILWYGDGPGHGFHKFKDYGRGVKPQVAGGRLVAFDDRAKQLTAIDAYTGRLLWKFDAGTSILRYATLPDSIIVGTNSDCLILNPENGAVIKTMPCVLDPKLTGTPGVVDMRVKDHLVLVAVGYDLPKGHSHSAIETGLWDAKTIVAFNRHSGTQLWSVTAKERFNIHSLVIGKNFVYCTDSISPLKADQQKRRGVAPETFPSEVLALDPEEGTIKWKFKRAYGYRAMTGRGPLAIRPYDDWSAYSTKSNFLYAGKLTEMQAINADTGEKVWEKPVGLQPLMLYDDSFINQAGNKYDLLTGKQLSKTPLFKRSGCNYTVGNQNLLFLRNNCASYVDLTEKKSYSLRNLRSGCSNSLVAADGLLSIPCFSTGCICNYPLQTSFAMVYMPEVSQWTTDDPIDVKQLRDAQTAITPQIKVNPNK